MVLASVRDSARRGERIGGLRTPRAGAYAPDVPQDDAVERAKRVLREAAGRLAAAGIADEAVAEFEPATRRLGIPRRARLRPVGRGWRLGVLLLSADGGVRATGAVTRAVPPGHPGHMAVSTEERREVRAAAFRAFPQGATVNYDAPVVPLTAEALRDGTGPLLLRDDGVRVRWSLSAGDDAARDLESYVAERVGLLLDPPRGAT
ncbi:hypothetical protein GCM10025783_25920 [Amnibacterium soli]|uniref:Glutaminase n=1 Tax=Amnibacterium soli TaxID=1282736 RepID=A0ABP8ZBR4_9MICO